MPAFLKSKVFIAVLAVVLVASAVAAGTVAWALQRIGAPGPLAEDRVHIVPSGAGVNRIAADLEETGIITSSLLFRLYVRSRRAEMKLRAGEYEFRSGASMAQIFDLLVAGRTVLHRVTIPEGLTSYEAIALLNAASPLTGMADIPAEGSILPETYAFTRDQDRTEIVVHMQESMTRTLAELWAGRADDLPIKTPEEAVILASIVERETGIAEERPRVAAVFVNRLRKRMRLQSDPTVIYALSDGKGRLDRELLLKDLEIDSPYNTYRVAGLPPGPICNPGRASLAAVLNPIESKELYFVADGTGGHVFAATLAEHERNVRNWRKIRREQRHKARREQQEQQQ
ncbi:MAG: endolytic transglycosylase MltG [Alphaproteobacteria bacterium]|nr:endolytic transglycosylase MltG [Alphaproteobacteria bacterium]